MSRVVELLRSRRVPQIAALALMSFGFAGCSADMQTPPFARFFPNPFASQPEATGSVPTPAGRAPRAAAIFARAAVAIPVPGLAAAGRRAPQSYPVASSGVSGGGRGLASYAPPAHPQLETTGTRCAAFGRGRASAGARRHHDHRRHQRYARNPGASATMSRRLRSCRPTATKARARCRPASN